MILLSKAHIDENAWYNIYLAEEKPEDLSPERLVFFGSLKEMKDFFGVSNIIRPASTAFSDLVSNDGTHISKLFEERGKKPEAIRQHEILNLPTMYKDYRDGSYTFSNDPVGSFDSAWEALGSPDTFAVYLILVRNK